MPEHLLEARVLRDVETTEAIFIRQRKALDEAGLLPVMFTRCIVTPVLAYIEREGMILDPERVHKEIEEQRTIKAQASAVVSLMSGGINMRSGKQMAEFIYGKLGFTEPRDRRGNVQRTASGKHKTEQNTLAGLSAKTEEQQSFLRLRSAYGKADSALSKYLEFYQGVCAEYGGRFMANFNQCRTKTQ